MPSFVSVAMLELVSGAYAGLTRSEGRVIGCTVQTFASLHSKETLLVLKPQLLETPYGQGLASR